MEEKKKYSLKELEQNINIDEFTKDWCSDDGLDINKLSEKYNGSIRNILRYAGNHSLKRSKQFIQNKVKQTNLVRYGVVNPAQNENIKNKVKQTNLVRYGVVNPAQNKEIKEKIKQTNLERYGVVHVLQNKELREKIKQTNLERYGVEYAAQNKEIQEKIKQTNLERYGVEHVAQNKEIQEKIKQINLEKYGVLYTCQADFCKNASNGMHSKPNENFAKLLDDNNIQYTREFPLKNKSYDFKINNILVEIDPCATHNSTWGTYNRNGLDKNYHKNKSNLAKQNNYLCVHVFDWDDQNKIINLLKPKTGIYARNCKIKEIQDDKEYQEFININHLQGYCKGNKIIIGLYYNDKLVETMSFGKPRYNKKFQYELLRLCVSAYSIIGGAEKIFKYFVNKYNPSSIISYCDISKFSGRVYEKLGFSEKNHTEPSKHWYNMKTGQHITDNLLRQRGFDQLFGTDYGKCTSNEALMFENGFVEIYDCGQATYIWKREG